MTPKPTFCLALAAVLLALAGCSSTAPARVSHGPIQARTFSFLKPAKAAPGFAETRPEVHAKIQEAITRNLVAKGLSPVEQKGDLTVGYLIIISDGGVTTAVNDYFGYRQDDADLQEKAHEAFAIKKKNPTPYPAGTLVIDLIQTRDYQLLVRNHASRPILRELPIEQRVTRLQEAVDEALKGVRVSR